jgi:hypothetical protein
VAGPAPTLRADNVELSAMALAAGAEQEDRYSVATSPAGPVGKSGRDTRKVQHLLHLLYTGVGGDISADFDGVGVSDEVNRADEVGASRPGPDAAGFWYELAGLVEHAHVDAALVLDMKSAPYHASRLSSSGLPIAEPRSAHCQRQYNCTRICIRDDKASYKSQ